MATPKQIKQQIIRLLDTLPAERLEEVVDFVEFLRMRHIPQPPTYTPIPLGGLWSDVVLSDEAMTEARNELWRGFGEREE